MTLILQKLTCTHVLTCGNCQTPEQMEDFDVNLVVDAAVWLWNKCKLVFGRLQTGIINSPKFLEKIDNCGKVQVSVLCMFMYL